MSAAVYLGHADFREYLKKLFADKNSSGRFHLRADFTFIMR